MCYQTYKRQDTSGILEYNLAYLEIVNGVVL
jgi:hypothetical protein